MSQVGALDCASDGFLTALGCVYLQVRAWNWAAAAPAEASCTGCKQAQLMLDVEEEYLPDLQPEKTRTMPQLQVRVVSEVLKLGRTAPVKLEIHNISAGVLGIVRVQVRAPRPSASTPIGSYIDFFECALTGRWWNS